MGAHKGNPMAINARKATLGDIGGLMKAVSEFKYAYSFEIVTEPNKAKQAEITAFLDAEIASGKDPKDINTHFDLTPEEQDVVVYHRISQLREMKVIQQTASINIRGPEHFRMPLHEVMARAQQAVDGGPPDAEA